MTIVLIGASGAGKSVIENEITHSGYKKIISYTTRKARPGEINGKDYYFISNETFREMLNDGLFAEYEEYSQGRYYGTLVSDYADMGENKVVVLTPGGFRQLLRKVPRKQFYAVLVQANLGTRVKRYIDRCGDLFNFDDMNEINARVNRDFGMFLGIERDVDFIVQNNEDKQIKDIVTEIFNEQKK